MISASISKYPLKSILAYFYNNKPNKYIDFALSINIFALVLITKGLKSMANIQIRVDDDLRIQAQSFQYGA